MQSPQGTLICNEVDVAINDSTAYSIRYVMLGHNVNLKGLLYDYLDNPIPTQEPFQIFSDMNDTNYAS